MGRVSWQGRSRGGDTAHPYILLASVKPRLGRALVESCTGSAWTFNIVEVTGNLSLFWPYRSVARWLHESARCRGVSGRSLQRTGVKTGTFLHVYLTAPQPVATLSRMRVRLLLYSILCFRRVLGDGPPAETGAATWPVLGTAGAVTACSSSPLVTTPSPGAGARGDLCGW